MTDLVAQLVGALEEARNQARHPDYDWPICLVHEIDAALSAAKDGGWLPIETAPKDELIVIYQPKFKRVTTSINDGFDWVHATHWQPLPNPPKGEV